MPNMLDTIKYFFTPVVPLPPGIHHYQAPPDASEPYRLHLRLDSDGSGILIVNASTILHLNQTAAEYAYHLVKQTPEDEMVRKITSRYRVNRQNVINDFQLLKERVDTLIQTPDLDPETFLDIDRSDPYSKKLTAPYRLDCALTYRLAAPSDAEFAPVKRVDRELSTEEWFEIIDKAWNLGIPHIIFTGGEPTLRDDLPALIAHTEGNGQVAGLLSDGLKLADSGYLQTLLQTGLDHMMFSLLPDSTESWRALESILPADLFVVAHLTLTLKNVMNASQTIERLKNVGVAAISLTASDPALHNKLLLSRNLAAELGLSLVWNLPVPYSSFNPVTLETQVDSLPNGAGHAWLYVEPDGDVLPSQGVDRVLGNILRDPWNMLWS